MQSAFREFSQELLEYQDRRERLIKLSRDITALSKRLIFLLHRVNPSNRDDLCMEARFKEEEIQTYFVRVGEELDGVSENNKWLFKQNYTGGLQEYVRSRGGSVGRPPDIGNQIEAISFYGYLQDPPALITLEETRKKLEGAKVHVSEEDYLLGLTDLTGELMRYGMNAIGSTGIQDSEAVVHQTEDWVRQIRAGEFAFHPGVD